MKHFIIVILIILPLISIGQANVVKYLGKDVILDNRVIEHYSSEYFNKLKLSSPELLIYQNYLVLNAFKIVDLTDKAKEENYNKISQIPKIESKNNLLNYSYNIENFNILNFDIQLKNENQVIDLENNNTFIIIETKEDFLKSFNDYKTKQLN
jgi:hypothetical protein